MAPWRPRWRPPPVAGIAIFLALGLGLALPLVVISLVPGIGRIVPRPGPWMPILHQALAFPVYASVLWLVWVASREGGSALLLAAGSGLLLIAFAGLARAAWWAGGASILAAVAVIALVPVLWSAQDARPDATQHLAAGGEPFSTARLAALRAAGKPAFVDLTAAWCVTCLLNERVALDQSAVQGGFRRAGVTYLVGDWTRGDPDITAYLRDNRRDGVPLVCLLSGGWRRTGDAARRSSPPDWC